jgi:hypothetical protein
MLAPFLSIRCSVCVLRGGRLVWVSRSPRVVVLCEWGLN